jgi:hypothetical protein
MAPVAMAINVIVMPIGAAAFAANAETWWRLMSHIKDATSIINQAFIAIKAEGTCKKIILTVEPCL